MSDKNDNGLRVWRGIVLGWTLVLIFLAGWLIVGFPHPSDGDSACYLPQMLTYKQHGTLVNALYGLENSPFHDGRYVWHGFLFPMVGGLVMPTASYAGVSIAMFLLELVALIAVGILAARARPAGFGAAAAKLILLLVVATWLGGFLGRPDLLVCTWCALGALGYCAVKTSRARIIIAGLTIGLVAATSPMPSLFLSLLFFGISAAKFSWRQCLGHSILAGLLAVAVFAAAFMIYPYGFGEWVHGVLEQAKSVEGGRHEGVKGFLTAWLLKFEAGEPMILVWCCPPLILAAKALWQKRCGWPLGVIFSLGASLVLVYFVAPDLRNYNVSCLLPVFLVPWLDWLSGDPSAKPANLGARWLPCFVIAVGLVTALPFIRDVVVRPYTKAGMSRAEAVRLAEEIRREHPKMDISNGLFTLFEDPKGLTIVFSPDGRSLPPAEDVLLLQQINPYRPVPPEIPHYRVAKNYFGNFAPMSIAGVKIANSPRGYNFAVYERVP